ncbi:CoA transferase [Aeromicrobium sp. UC242_57]|uniref:CoA transferase n=1 Tax=Aeromicrobium sp. UC242_57 TaxID=3374624 RepID=UPI0037A8AD04
MNGQTRLPLEGITVIEVGRFISAPWAAQLLADFGADVIKIEHPVGGDLMRMSGPHLLDAEGNKTQESAYYLSTNRNKRSVALDYTRPEGREVLLQRIGRADVLLENARPGSLTKHGLDDTIVAGANRQPSGARSRGSGSPGRAGIWRDSTPPSRLSRA